MESHQDQVGRRVGGEGRYQEGSKPGNSLLEHRERLRG